MAVRSINGLNYHIIQSPEVINEVMEFYPIKIPRIIEQFDASRIHMSGLSGQTVFQALQEFAPMCAEKIDGTTDDYVLNMSGFPD